MVHRPVLLESVLHYLAPERGGWFVDGTVGGGGHAEAILERWPTVCLLGLDRDPSAVARARVRLGRFGQRARLLHGDYRELERILAQEGIGPVSGVLLDLGLSSDQLETAERGFSFLRDEPLDMRFDPSSGTTAAQWLARTPEGEITRVLIEYGEERHARRIARAIVGRRSRAPIQTTAELAQVVRSAVPPPARHRRVHVATRTFQAIRIAVNGEVEGLHRVLPEALEVLVPGGRLAVISFHSVEDRIVKTRMRAWAKEGRVTLMTPKPVTAEPEEIAVNPRARSAKLRAVERR